MPSSAPCRRSDRQAAERLADDASGHRWPDVLEVLAVLGESFGLELAVVTIVVKYTGFVNERSAEQFAVGHHAGIAAGRDLHRAKRAVGEVQVADAGRLLEAERHLEPAGLDA